MRRPRAGSRSGAAALSVLVILAPVLLVLMGLAVDLGRLYLIKGELKTAANAMALAGAQNLVGTEQSTGLATANAQTAIQVSSNLGNKYDFAGLTIGQESNLLASSVDDPEYFDTAASAIGESENATGGTASGAAARHMRITLRAEAPLIFFGLIPLGQDRKVPIVMRSVAGMSAPLCQACGITNIAIAAIDTADGTDFGYVPGTRYTLGYTCTGAPNPGNLPNTTARVPYLLLDKLDSDAQIFADETSQLYRIGASGLPASTSETKACFQISSTSLIWTSAATLACNTNRVQPAVTALGCGLAARFDPTVPAACASVAEVDTLAGLNTADTDLTDLDDYTQYTGNLRRVITVPVVDALAAGTEMTVLGFRQFLLQPSNGATTLDVDATNGRFPALYIGSVVPLRQGRMSGCTITAGPGKVVLHR
ncbi:MAG: pilus assembly protein TadG-related protein [Acidobacteria bacterium]|nr:pilus assembly protein TadG-related protein [Acidobacteriota bacterium]